jgi:outer membrane protein OmpA-like peptidoglycan-associated protein
MVLIMNILKTSVFVLLLSISLSGNVFGQQSRLQFSNKQFELTNYRLAADGYLAIYSDKQEYEIGKKAAISLDKIYEYGESYPMWKSVVTHEEAVKEDYVALVRAGMRSVEGYDPALDLANSPYTLEDFPEFSVKGLVDQKKVRIYQLNPLSEVNSNSSDYSISGGSSDIQFFASNRGEQSTLKKAAIRLDAGANKIRKDYYSSDQKNYYVLYSKNTAGEIEKVQVEGFELFHLTDPQLLSNGMMFFTGTPNRISRRDAVIHPGLFYGYYDAESNSVRDVEPFPYNETNTFGIMSPRFDESQNKLYFASDIPGGLGGYDLYYVDVDSEMKFSKAMNLGPAINSSFNERDPFPKENDFFFTSDRNGGYGGLDVYSASMTGGEFGSVVNLGQPINSNADDFGFIKISNKEAFLASDRVGGQGYDDIYAVSWADKNFKLNVVDRNGNSLREGSKVQLMKDSGTNDVSKMTDGEIFGMLEMNNSHSFVADHNGYFVQNQIVEVSQDLTEVTIVLTPIPFGLEVYEAIIYYDLDKDFLRELSKEKLEEITKYMTKYSSLNLRIESHTDARASDKYNQKLSERRAKSVIKYLDGKGVYDDRVKAFWFSKSKLANDCGDGIPCPEDKHQLNRRSELKLVAFPDRSQSYTLPEGATVEDFQSVESARRWFNQQ